MKFVNTASRIIYRSATGRLEPGKKTPDTYRNLEKVLEEIVETCGKDLRIILNAKEAQLLARVMDLDDAGTKFDPASIPAEIRNDPTGIKRLSERERQFQHQELQKTAKANKEAEKREALINGEVDEKPAIKPIGVDRSGEAKDGKGEAVSGFAEILAENARIAAGQTATSAREIADPIGANAKAEQPEQAEQAGEEKPEQQDQPEQQEQAEQAGEEKPEPPEQPPEDFSAENGAKDAPAPAKKGKEAKSAKAPKAKTGAKAKKS